MTHQFSCPQGNNQQTQLGGEQWRQLRVSNYQHKRLTRLATVIGSCRMRAGVAETGSFFVSTNWAVKSGVNVINVSNYGRVPIDIRTALSPTSSFFNL